MRGLAFRRAAGLATVLCVCFVLGTTFGASGARAAAGDFQIDFAAAAPFSYDHSTGGGAWNDKTIGRYDDVVESLEGGDFFCGDIVTYLVEVVVDEEASLPAQTLGMAFGFLADSTGQSGVGHVDVVGAMVNDGAGDSGVVDDGGSAVSVRREEMVGTPFTKGAELQLEVELTDLEPGERVIVRIDTRLGCDPALEPTGNLQGGIARAWLVPGGEAVPVGEQTVPFKEVQRIGLAGIDVVKTADPISHPEPGGSSTFSVTVSNTGDLALTLYSLVDSIHGDLDGKGTCAVPQTLPVGSEGVYRCTFSAPVRGVGGYTETDVVTGRARDESGREVVDTDDATVSITSVPASTTTTTPPGPALGSIGDFVWFDADGDGVQDGVESGIAGATVRLFRAGGGLVSTTVTDAAGFYRFAGLEAGKYVVEFALPDVPGFSSEAFTLAGVGADDRDSDADTVSGRTGEIDLSSGENDPTWDAGVVGAAVLAAQVESTTTVAAVTLPFTGGGGAGPGTVGVWLLAAGACALAITRREEVPSP